MARKNRLRFEGALYHAINRGIDRRDLFWDAKDYAVFLAGLELGVERFHTRILAYCLMPNHFHLLVETPLGNIDRFMQGVQTRYAGWFNLRHRRSGYVYQGPYQAKLVGDDSYLLRLSRYIHLNAVRIRSLEGQPLADSVRALRAYRWSSYREYIGSTVRKDWMTYAPLEEHLREQAGRRRGAYRAYVEAGLAESDEEFESLMRQGGVCLGEAADLDELRQRLERRSGPTGESGLGRNGRFLAVAAVVGVVRQALGADASELSRRRGGAWARGILAEMLCRYAGLTNQQAAAGVGVTTGAAVCVLRRNLHARLQEDAALQARVAALEQGLKRAII